MICKIADSGGEKIMLSVHEDDQAAITVAQYYANKFGNDFAAFGIRVKSLARYFNNDTY